MNRTIVVIDGEPVVRTVITSILENAGYSVAATDDVSAVVEGCRKSPPALVITNVTLPGITGHDAMRLIKENCPEIPVLMVSGVPSEPVIQKWMNEDGFDIFPKPFTANSLVSKVEEILNTVSR